MAGSHVISAGSYACGEKGGTYAPAPADPAGPPRCAACGALLTDEVDRAEAAPPPRRERPGRW